MSYEDYPKYMEMNAEYIMAYFQAIVHGCNWNYKW